jgi:thioredoxin reductase
VIIVGDGPGGLSAALFLAKNGHEVTVYGQDKTAMHYAHIYNYLGLPEIAGTEFQAIAREQVAGFGAELVDEAVESVSADGRVSVTTADGGTREADYLILTEGKNPVLAQSLGLATPDGPGVEVDDAYRSSLDRVYVVGEAGGDVQDWDTPPKE